VDVIVKVFVTCERRRRCRRGNGDHHDGDVHFMVAKVLAAASTQCADWYGR
jgi:hypothetical protein